MLQLTERERHLEEINTRGYTVINDVLPKNIVAEARVALDQIFAYERNIAPALNTSDYHVSFCLAHKDKIFRSICQIPETMDLVRSVLGNDCTLSVINGMSMQPGGTGQQLHFDQTGPPGEVELLTILFPLDDFSRENGCTRLIPGSHKMVHPAGTTADHTSTQFKHLEDQAIYIEIPTGSVIVYSGLILHAGSSNNTVHPRHAMMASYCPQWIKPQWNFIKSMPRHAWAAFTEEERMLFGYYAEQPLIYDHKTAYIYTESNLHRNLDSIRRKVDKLVSLLLR